MSTLLERIGALAPGGVGGLTTQDSVLRNLIRVFNARAGESLTRPDYGMPVLEGRLGRSGLEAVKTHVKDLVESFEPRLDDVGVWSLDEPLQADPSKVELLLVARLLETGAIVRYRASVDAAGRVELT